MTLAAIPSPTHAVWQIGPVPIRAYALCIILGIILAAVVTEHRLRARGAHKWAVLDVAVWAVPFGIIGARIYHVITSPGAYFGEGGDPLEAFMVWKGGLGIWGAVAGGAVGALFAARQLGMPLTVVADTLAPGLPLAQAVGRLGNWFNNELYGRQTTLPWGLQVHEMDSAGQPTLVDGEPVLRPGLYQPTFLYELVWNVLVAGVVLWLDRKFKFGKGRAFAVYVMGYTLGRFFVEMLRDDTATHILGVRINVFVAALVFIGALVYFLRVSGPREYLVPIGLDAPVPAQRDGDISTVDVSAKPAEAAIPSAYRVVTEEQFKAYQETGAVPDTDESVTTPEGVDAETDDESDAVGTDRADDAGHDSDTTAAGAGGRADDR
ncbi:prolipoprotein diacylglyceryl transferase [Asanoa ishikariensis]|uniref:Phosphatidylglycerol--prolipoprotein diacylglyceryl transferase n=1 Tax=Asanoa ishikariensis TaxID=137265 RepID=A0A1H3P966_9ACTN|nr:prolipoprotein diacylglyceryl transferase [Asanoa ishikariensis]GIF68014.1 prolipoprotein diacylglyceryl transferase [Asanoa ishikariensis]SDY97611.1 prolipoprotein diacylglyceryl transferase [Asanoa ishikariensis]